jgi:hypothetical protein
MVSWSTGCRHMKHERTITYITWIFGVDVLLVMSYIHFASFVVFVYLLDMGI